MIEIHQHSFRHSISRLAYTITGLLSAVALVLSVNSNAGSGHGAGHNDGHGGGHNKGHGNSHSSGHGHGGSMPSVVEFNEPQKQVALVLQQYGEAASAKSAEGMASHTVADESFVVIEGGHANFGWQNYHDTHLVPELNAIKALKLKFKALTVDISGARATSAFSYTLMLDFGEGETETKAMGTAVFKSTDLGWKIMHLQI